MLMSLLEEFRAKARRLDRRASKTLKVGDLVVYEPFGTRRCHKGRIIKIDRAGLVTLAVPSKKYGVVERVAPGSEVRCVAEGQ